MKVLSAKKYNEQQYQKWQRDWETAKTEGRGWGEMPQLAFYWFRQSYGFVAFGERTALWAKTKKEVVGKWEQR